MYRLISLSAMLVIAADASQYYYAPLGPWGLESTIINAKEVRKADTDTKKVITTSRRAFVGKKKAADKKVEEVKSTVDDDLEQAEEAFFHAVENVESAVAHAIDDEVEILFPHHKKEESDIKAVKSTSKKEEKVEEVKKGDVEDDFEQAEEAIFHAVEHAEEAVAHALDDEVETLFPHHKKEE